MTKIKRDTIDRDRRYKVTPEIVLKMRYMRANGSTLREIGERFKVSGSTALYWTSKEQRNKQRAKNALRTHAPGETTARIKRDGAKRAENWANPGGSAMKLRHTIQSAKDETRRPRHTVKGMKMSDAEKLLKSGKLKRPNSKMGDLL